MLHDKNTLTACYGNVVMEQCFYSYYPNLRYISNRDNRESTNLYKFTNTSMTF
jgi:hypothetical protein